MESKNNKIGAINEAGKMLFLDKFITKGINLCIKK